MELSVLKRKCGRNARFERRETRLGQQLVGALLLDLMGAQLERGCLELIAQCFVGCDAQAQPSAR